MSQPYVNLFGEDAPEPGARPEKPKRPPAAARPVPAFVVGAVRYEKMDVAWVNEAGETVTLTLTARAAQAMFLKAGQNGDSPADTNPRTARAPHVRGSATSEAAARKMDRKLAGKRLTVLEWVCRWMASGGGPGYTDNQITHWMVSDHLWNPNTARARRIELVRDGWLEDSGERRAGCTVWRPTSKAWTWWNGHQAKKSSPQNP